MTQKTQETQGSQPVTFFEFYYGVAVAYFNLAATGLGMAVRLGKALCGKPSKKTSK